MIAWLVATSAWGACFVVSGATVEFPAGPSTGIVVVDGGKIVAAGPTVDAKAYAACTAVDGSGQVLTAGLVESQSHLGVVEIDQENQTSDFDQGDADKVRSSLRVADAYNPRSTSIPVTRIAGVTSAVVVPSGGLVSGQSAWVELSGDVWADVVPRPSVDVVANLGGPSKAAALDQLRELFDLVRQYGRYKADWQHQMSMPPGVTEADLVALQPVLSKAVPLVVGADRASDISAVLRFAAEEQVRVVISGGAEGWLVATELAAAKVPVIVDPLVYGPGGFDQIQAREDNPALLAKAGVPVVLASFGTQTARTLRQVAGNAVRGGMDHEAALKAVTTTPADAFGMSDRGRIAVGQVADLVLWSGDPFELSTRVAHVWIGGKDVALESRQTALLAKYRTLPGTPVTPLDPAGAKGAR